MEYVEDKKSRILSKHCIQLREAYKQLFDNFRKLGFESIEEFPQTFDFIVNGFVGKKILYYTVYDYL